MCLNPLQWTTSSILTFACPYVIMYVHPNATLLEMLVPKWTIFFNHSKHSFKILKIRTLLEKMIHPLMCFYPQSRILKKTRNWKTKCNYLGKKYNIISKLIINSLVPVWDLSSNINNFGFHGRFKQTTKKLPLWD